MSLVGGEAKSTTNMFMTQLVMLTSTYYSGTLDTEGVLSEVSLVKNYADIYLIRTVKGNQS